MYLGRAPQSSSEPFWGGACPDAPGGGLASPPPTVTAHPALAYLPAFDGTMLLPSLYDAGPNLFYTQNLLSFVWKLAFVTVVWRWAKLLKAVLYL